MPIEKANVVFYKVTDCGYYKRGVEAPDFGNLLDTLDDLLSWCHGKSLVQTKVFEPIGSSDVLPTYVVSLHKHQHKAWLLTIWNQTPTPEGGVASIKADSAVGATEVFINEVEEGSIPGFATYFWFLPDQGVFASIRFQHPVTAWRGMQHHVENFMSKFSRHAVRVENDEGEIVVTGYLNEPADQAKHRFPRFRAHVKRKAAEREIIKAKVGLIRRVLRKTDMKLAVPANTALWQRMIKFVGATVPDMKPEVVRVKYEIDLQPSSEDLDAIFSAWDESHESEWDDYGFLITGETKPRWLSNTIASTAVDLDVERDNAEVINPLSLLNALYEKRQSILKVLE